MNKTRKARQKDPNVIEWVHTSIAWGYHYWSVKGRTDWEIMKLRMQIARGWPYRVFNRNHMDSDFRTLQDAKAFIEGEIRKEGQK